MATPTLRTMMSSGSNTGTPKNGGRTPSTMTPKAVGGGSPNTPREGILEGIQRTVDLLQKHKSFGSAAAYNMRCLDSLICNNGVSQDLAAVDHLVEVGGVKAVLECLGNCSVSAGNVLLTAGCTVLNRVLRLRSSHSHVMMELEGVQVVIRALQNVDDRPYQAIEFLGLMAEAGHVGVVVDSGGLILIQDSLTHSHITEDDAMLSAAVTSLGRVALGLEGRRDEVLATVESFLTDAVCDIIMENVKNKKVKEVEAVGAAVAALDWLATGQEAILTSLKNAGAVPFLLDIISMFDDKKDIQKRCGHLIYELSREDELKLALEQLDRLSNEAIEGGEIDMDDVRRCLNLIGGVALASEGRRSLVESENAIQKLLHLCDSSLDEVVRMALTALERVAVEAQYGRVVYEQGGMDKAASVLKRSADEDSISPETAAAATLLTARLTEVSMLLNLRRHGSPSEKFNRRGSFQEAKLDALRGSILAYGRHPGNSLLFRSLIDLALSNLQRRAARRASSGTSGEDTSACEPSSMELLLVETSLDTLNGFSERDLPKEHQAIFRDKIWSDFGVQGAIACLLLDDQELALKACHVWARTAGLEPPHKKEDLVLPAYFLQYSKSAEDFLDILERSNIPGPGEALRIVLRNVVDLKPKESTGLVPSLSAVVDGDGNGEYDVSDDEIQEVEEKQLPTDTHEEDAPLVEESDIVVEVPILAVEEESDKDQEERGHEEYAISSDGEVPSHHDDLEEHEEVQEEAEAPPMVPGDPPPWVQVVDSEGMVYFLNTSTGEVQWEVPDDIAEWWDKVALHDEAETIKRMGGWEAKADPLQRVVYFERDGLKVWRLPSNLQVSLDKDPDSCFSSPSRHSRTSLSPEKAARPPVVFEDEDDDNNNFNNQQVEEEEEELQPKQQPQSAAAPAMDALDSREQEELRGLLESLDDFRDEVEVARHHPKGPDILRDGYAHYKEVVNSIKARYRPTGHGSAELEDSLAESLKEAMGLMEDMTDLLNYYKGMYERELGAHQQKGEVAPLEVTMAYLKGELLQHTPGELPSMAKIITLLENSPTEVEKTFKDAHLFIKRLVVEVAGEQVPNTHWTLKNEDLDKIPDLYWQQIYHKLKLLVLSYDNMNNAQKSRLTTAAEIIKNREWLVLMAIKCVNQGAATVRRSSSGNLGSIINPKTTTGSLSGRRPSDPKSRGVEKKRTPAVKTNTSTSRMANTTKIYKKTVAPTVPSHVVKPGHRTWSERKKKGEDESEWSKQPKNPFNSYLGLSHSALDPESDVVSPTRRTSLGMTRECSDET